MDFGFRGVKIFALEGSNKLAQKVCNELTKKLPGQLVPESGLKLAEHEIVTFDNQNVMAKIENIRGHFVVIIHTQCPPVHTRIFELFALLDAIFNSNASDLLVVFPYMPYARSDRKDQPRISVMGSVLPQIFNKTLGVKRVILLDPHDPHTKHYFRPSADEISSIYLFADFAKQLVQEQRDKILIAFSDGGAAKRFSKFPSITKFPFDYIDKARTDDNGGLEIKRSINATGKICLMVDDEICSGGTSIMDAETLKANGAEKIIMLVPHGVLAKKNVETKDLLDKLEASPIDHFIFTDTIPIADKIKDRPKFHFLSIAGLLAEAIKQTIENDSVTKLHDPNNTDIYRPVFPQIVL